MKQINFQIIKKKCLADLAEVFPELLGLKIQRILEILVLGQDGDLGAVHGNDPALEVLELALHHLHIVPVAELVAARLLLVACSDVDVQSLRGLLESVEECVRTQTR